MNMPKHYKDMMDEIINKIDETKVKENAPTSADIERLKKQGLKTKTEDAPANAVAHGGVDMNPTGRKRVMGTLKRKVQESDDNNNVVLKGVYKVLNKLEEKIDELSGVVKEEIKIETPKRKKTIKARL
jgi:hypothetical protein